jgi:hypothetical protein
MKPEIHNGVLLNIFARLKERYEDYLSTFPSLKTPEYKING